jgi:DHA2 family multidrug resistance protein
MPTFMMLLVMTSPLPGRARVAGLAVFSLAASAGLGLAALRRGLADRPGRLAGPVLGAGPGGPALHRPGVPGPAGRARRSPRLRKADWGGYGLLSLALGLLIIGVSEGERHFWFETWWITAAFACGGLALILAIRLIPRAPMPLLRLELFAGRP